MIRRLTIVALLLGGIAKLGACTHDTGAAPAATVRNETARMLADARATDPLTARPRPADAPDPCDGVSEAAVVQVEAQMRQLDRELVVLGTDELQALDCSRSRLPR